MTTAYDRRQARRAVARELQPERDIVSHLAGVPGAAAALAVAETVEHYQPQPEVKVRLYDVVDGTWTRPIPEQLATQLYLRLLSYSCSACTWTTEKSTTFAAHVGEVEGPWQEHQKAELQVVSTTHGTAYRCSGCGTSYQMASRTRLHIMAMSKRPADHRVATLRLIRRYALEPPAAHLVAPNVSNGNGDKASVGPAGAEVERSGVRRRRRRSRHRSRSGHGNAAG